MKINLIISLEDEQIEFLKNCDRKPTKADSWNDFSDRLVYFGLIEKVDEVEVYYDGTFPVYSATPLGRLVLASMT